MAHFCTLTNFLSAVREYHNVWMDRPKSYTRCMNEVKLFCSNRSLHSKKLEDDRLSM